LVDGLVVQDNTWDVGWKSIVGCEEQFTICTTVVFGVLTSDVLKIENWD
jgi:hypothetical protein